MEHERNYFSNVSLVASIRNSVGEKTPQESQGPLAAEIHENSRGPMRTAQKVPSTSRYSLGFQEASCTDAVWLKKRAEKVIDPMYS